MLAVIAGALAARRAQALSVLLLAVLASAGAAAAPIYAAAAGRAVASVELSAAKPEERLLRFASGTEYGGMPADPARSAFGAEVHRLAPAGFDIVFGAQGGGKAVGPTGEANSTLVFREGVCERVAVTGACPASTQAEQRPQVMVSTNTAAGLGVTVGGEVRFRGVPLLVAGIYRPLDAVDPYWISGEYLRPALPGQPSVSAVGSAEDAIFTAGSPALAAADLTNVPTADLFVTEHLLRTRSTGELHSAVTTAAREATYQRLGTGNTELTRLLDRIALDRRQLTAGVTLGAALLVLLCWLVLFVAVGSAADERRPEQGLLLLRGVQRRRLWALAVGEHAVPVLAAVPVGCLAGFAAAELLASYTLAGDTEVALDAAALGYATVAAVGALAAVLLAELRTMSAAVVDLLRRVPARTRGWRAGAGDVVALSVAVAAVVQLRAGGPPSGLALLAPVATALAVGVLVARIAMLAGAAVGAALLRRGRIGAGLGVVQLARQPGLRLVIALLTVAVGMLAFTAGAREVATAAYADRATVEVGAPRVVGVEAMSRRHLLEAVRAIDPERRFAMAVVTSHPGRLGTPVLALSADRLAAVAAPHASYGWSMPAVARAIRPDPPTAAVPVRGPFLTATITSTYDPRMLAEPNRPRLFVSVASRSGIRRIVAAPRVVPGRGDYRVPIPECVPECRLVSIELDVPVVPTALRIRVTELRHGADDAVLMTAEDLGKPARWRLSQRAGETVSTSTEPGLLLDFPPGDRNGEVGLAVADAPYPLPAWTARSEQVPVGHTKAYDGVDSQPAKAQVVGTVDRLPRLGAAGLVVDLEYADRLAVAGRSGVEEVWLGTAAPADVLDRLRGQGLVVRYDRTTTAVRQEFGRQGPALALNFNLFAALAGVLIGAAGLATVAAAEQRDRVAALVALRRQGLPARAIRGGYGWLVAVGAVAGALATTIGWLLARDGQRLFNDGRSPAPVPVWPDVGWLAVATLPAIALLLVTAVVLSRTLAVAVHRRTRP